MKERYYSESLLRSLAYDDDVNGNCDGMIDFTVIDSISGADVAPVVYGEWRTVVKNQICQCTCCLYEENINNTYNYCPNCGARMDGVSN